MNVLSLVQEGMIEKTYRNTMCRGSSIASPNTCCACTCTMYRCAVHDVFLKTLYTHMYMCTHSHPCICIAENTEMVSFAGMEARVREMSRQLSLSELGREQLSSDLEALRLQVQDGQHWETEKQVT